MRLEDLRRAAEECPSARYALHTTVLIPLLDAMELVCEMAAVPWEDSLGEGMPPSTLERARTIAARLENL